MDILDELIENYNKAKSASDPVLTRSDMVKR